MTREEFKKLKVGDQIYHPHVGVKEITWVERYTDFEASVDEETQLRPEMTISFEIAGGNRMKIDDDWDLPRTRTVEPGELCGI